MPSNALGDSTVLIMAKEPVPGRVKTRLCPPCTPAEAAAVAAGALTDTISAALDVGARQVVLALDGRPGPWVPAAVEVIAQRGDGFGERLTNAWMDVGGPTVQIGMDTPQVTAALLAEALSTLHSPGTDAVLAPAEDGGWWLLGLRQADRRMFDGIEMSRTDTGALQRERLRDLRLSTRLLRRLRDIDSFDDATQVCAGAPHLLASRALAPVAARLRRDGAASAEVPSGFGPGSETAPPSGGGSRPGRRAGAIGSAAR